MANNVLIIESYVRTRPWIKALAQLDDITLNVASLMSSERGFLSEVGLANANILDLSSIDWKEALPRHHDSLLTYECKMNLSINSIIGMDRILKNKSRREAVSYLALVADRFIAFCKKNYIDQIFMEATWAYEILITELATILGISVLVPHTVRIPDDRFLFFKGAFQENYYIRESSPDILMKDAEKILEGVRFRNLKPRYLSLNNSKNAFRLNWAVKLFKKLIYTKRNKYVEWSVLELVKNRLSSWLRFNVVSKSLNFKSLNDLNKPFILITLHVQPESTVDVLAYEYSNQIELVRKVSLMAPLNYTIAVKEHSNAIGDRPRSFYRSLNAIPGVVLLDPRCDSHKAIDESSLVLSLTGTVCLEAAIRGKRSVTVKRMFFQDLLVAPKFDPLIDSLEELLVEQPKSNESILNSYYSLLRNSFPGNVGEPRLFPEIMEENNINRLKSAFSEVMQHR